MNLQDLNAGHTAWIHDWSAFWTVVCLGLVQIAVTYYSSRLTIDSLPDHVPDDKRRKHKGVLTVLVTAFILLTLSLGKLNDDHQYQADLLVERERAKQEALEQQLQRTLDAVTGSEAELMAIRHAVSNHPEGDERNSMLNSIDRVTSTLNQQSSNIEHQMHSNK